MERSKKRYLHVLAPFSLATALTLTACVGTGVRDYEGWRASVERGQPCSVLHDIRRKLPASVDRAQVDEDLKEIGCDSPAAKRTDR